MACCAAVGRACCPRGTSVDGEDAVAMQVALRREDAPSRRRAPRATITEHSKSSGSSFSSTQGTPPASSQAAASSSRVAHARLALAVVAQARGLQDAGQQRRGTAASCVGGLDHGMRRARHAAAHEVRLLADAVLRDRHRSRRPARPGRAAASVRQRGRRHVLEFGGDGVAPGRPAAPGRRRRGSRRGRGDGSPARPGCRHPGRAPR